MTIIVKDKNTLLFKDFQFRCCVGKNNFSKKKIEGDKKTPIGIFDLGHLYYRADRFKKPLTKLKTFKINKNMGWCNDTEHKKYNRLIKINKKIGCEKLFRKDFKYDFILPIKYNYNKVIPKRGSAIFIHCKSKENKFTEGCIGIEKEQLMQIIRSLTPLTRFIIS